ncbi:MAG: LamG domain-containing protein [Planctomycetota bacterium]
MTNFTQLFATGAIASACLFGAPSAQAEIADELVSYWDWEGSFNDQFGAGNGTGINTPGFNSGLFGQALELAGGSTDNYVEITNESLYDFGAAGNGFTFSTWTRVDAFDTDFQTLISKGDGFDQFRAARYFGTPQINFVAGGGGAELPHDGSQPAIDDGAWYHIVTVHNGGGGNNELWINGSLITSGSRTDVADTDNSLWIGNNPDNPDRGWDGLLDDTAIWGRALSSSEITQIYNEGLGGNSLATIIPEPGSLALLGLGGLLTLRRRR